ncbi:MULTISPECIES: hypothetical protein [unclassified Paraburkholderia]|uniref:hypothetical protein n=1 Tax=unclassified Paraburkholderia TaxID=2615204 RepID=UPI002AB28749|nr:MULTISPECIES: hypothetical protein [unclassified Paraburkholderia]
MIYLNRGAIVRPLTLFVLVFVTLFSGCAAYRTHEARTNTGNLIGSNVLDLVAAVGIPDKTMKLVDANSPTDRMVMQWNFSNSDSAFEMNVILLDLKLGGAGKCSMTATVDRWGGRVLSVNFPQAHSDSINSDYSACEPLVAEALSHLGHTPIDPRFDSFKLVGAAK